MTLRPHPVTSDCLALWRFNELLATDKCIDSSGNGHNGTPANNPPCVPGKIDGARDFNAAGRMFTVADASSFHVQKFTLAAWVYFNGDTDWYPKVVHYDSTAADGIIILDIFHGTLKPETVVFFTTGAVALIADTDASVGWHHKVVTFDGVTLCLYFDGLLSKFDATLAGKVIDYSSPDAFYIGCDPDDLNHEFWRGYIDELAFYSTAKSASWVRRYAGLTNPAAAPYRAPTQYSNRFDHLITDKKDLSIDDYGRLERDETVASRCNFRLLCRRGEYVYDVEMGSRFHELKTLKDARRRSQIYADEALSPLVDQGEISSVEVGEVALDSRTGFIGIPLTIHLPDGTPIELETLRIKP